MATSMRCICDTCNTHKTLDNTKHIIYTDFNRYPYSNGFLNMLRKISV